jgi:hypothetical protein
MSDIRNQLLTWIYSLKSHMYLCNPHRTTCTIADVEMRWRTLRHLWTTFINTFFKKIYSHPMCWNFVGKSKRLKIWKSFAGKVLSLNRHFLPPFVSFFKQQSRAKMCNTCVSNLPFFQTLEKEKKKKSSSIFSFSFFFFSSSSSEDLRLLRGCDSLTG